MLKHVALPLALMSLPVVAPAQSYDDLARVEVLSGWRVADGSHIAALQITLRPGWVTYWRAPGDSGIPPEISFTGDSTIISITPHWPTPEVFGEDGMRSIGYHDGVTVPLEIALADGAGSVAVSGEITIGVCEEICIPVTLPFGSLLPQVGANDATIADAWSERPVSADAAGVSDVACTIAPIEDGLRVTAEIALPERGTDEHVVIEAADPRIWVSEAQVNRNGNALSASVDMVHPSGGPFALDRSGMRITVLGSGRAIDIRGCRAG